MALRGFDDYEVTLGDEMRGYRASKGVSLADVERDLRIRSSTILAIENADLSGFPNQSVIPGYIRTYARYLGMDPDQCYRRFCDESGFKSPTATVAVAAAGSGESRRVAINSRAGANLTASRFAPPPAPSRIGSSVSLGAVGSGLAMIALIGGLSYGGYHLLQDIQKVGVAPLPKVTETAAAADVVAEPAPTALASARADARRPDASAYEDGGILALAAADTPPPVMASRDGPIADLDPNSSGLFASVGRLDPNDPRKTAAPAPGGETKLAAGTAAPASWSDGVLLASLSPDAMATDAPTDAERLTMSARAMTEELTPKAKATIVRATEEAWIRIKDGDGTVVFEGILAPGEQFELPAQMRAPEIRAGNAGGVYIGVGNETFGPLGAPGRVVKNVPLTEDAVRTNLPAAEGIGPTASEDATVESAEATL